MPAAEEDAVLAALQKFAESVTAKMTALTEGEPEDQLRGPLEVLMQEVGKAISRKVVCTGETKLPGRLGKPDYAVHASDLLAGYVELKSPGTGANTRRFTGHNREQAKRFSALPNLLYCDGNDWALYRQGERVRPIVRLSSDVAADGKDSVNSDDAQKVLQLLCDFLSWRPEIPITANGVINLRELAELLAPLCRMLRQDVADALKDPQSPLVQIAQDWREALFSDADDERFADSYAQTVTFALLLARSEGAHPLTLSTAQEGLAADHTLLSRALQVLTDTNARAEISASLNILVRVIGTVPTDALEGQQDPWLYFYEDFLAAYDAKLRKDIGAYYTPVEVVRAQVRLVDDLLTNRLGKPLGFADPQVVTLDPAVGTGTYLLGIIEHALQRVQAQQGQGAVPGKATSLAGNLYGFEILVGPYAVAELRVTRLLSGRGASLPEGGTHVYLTDTLESPHAPPPSLPFYLQPIAQQRASALKVKAEVPVIACLGNPPYDRHEAADETNKARTGGWIRWGDEVDGVSAVFKDFLDPALAAGHGVHVKNLYNLYVYFWRWALWKVFEHTSASGPGVVSYISASSYLDGDAFCGMREHMRRVCDEVWIVDLGGEGRGSRKSENVFAIKTPVAIAVAVRDGSGNADIPAKVHYAEIAADTSDQKLAKLDAIRDFSSLDWKACPDEWQGPFRPVGKGEYFTWSLLTDLFPWQHSGAQFKRKWPISPNAGVLTCRWKALLNAQDRAVAFKETRDRTVTRACAPLPGRGERGDQIASLRRNASAPPVERYAYRSFDRQWIFADSRLGDFLRPELWAAHSERQIYLTSLITKPLGLGPAMTACSEIPDLDHFSGRGAKDAIPLYRDAEAAEPNILPGLLEVLAEKYGAGVTPEDFFAYVYGILAHPDFTERYAEELASREIRVPITADAKLFAAIRDVGRKLLWLHTYGQRCLPKGRHRGVVPKGAARCTQAVPGDEAGYPDGFEHDASTSTLRVGEGAFAPVSAEVYNFEVSGLKVVQSWLGYRMKNPRGRKSSPLDEIRPEQWTGDFTTELLEMLWILEATIAEYPLQAKLLTAAATMGALKI